MTDTDIKNAYLRATGRYLSENLLSEARAFIGAIFDNLTPAGFIDGAEFAEEEWMLTNPTPLYRKPE